MNATGPSSLLNLTDHLDGERRLARFFTKLLEEALHLGAERVHFERSEPEQMRASFFRGRDQIKYVDLKAGWLNPIRSWLGERRSKVFVTDQLSAPVVVSVIGRCVQAELVETPESVTLNSIRVLPVRQAIELAGFFGHSSTVWSKVTEKDRGLLIVCSGRSDTLAQSLAIIKALTPALDAPLLSDLAAISGLAAAAQDELVVTGVLGFDAVELLCQLSHAHPVLIPSICGVVGTAFAPGVCQHCATRRPISTVVLNRLPRELYPLPKSERYGAGCAACDEQGVVGVTALQSVVDVSENVRRVLAQGGGPELVLELAYAAGTRSLIEDGTAKVEAGKVTMEDVRDVASDIPTAYKERRNKGADHREEAIEVQVDDFFTGDQAVSPPPQVAHEAFPNGTPESTLTKGKPVLLVAEDDPDQRSILELVFSAQYDVRTAVDGEDAWKAVQKERPDIIVTDLMMPKVDGGELLSRLKAHSTLRSIPVLVLTVVTDSEREYALLDLGADDYCEKTIQRKVLLKRIENLLRRASVR